LSDRNDPKCIAPRDLGLAGARLARQQHGQIEAGELPGRADGHVHRRMRRAQHGFEAHALAQGAAALFDARFGGRGQHPHLEREALVLAGQREQAGGVADRHQKLFGMPGLGQELVDPGCVDRLDHGRGVGVAGDDHAHGFGPARAQLGQKRDPGLIRHALIAQHHLDPFAFHQLRGFGAARRGQDLELVLQRHAHRRQRMRLVIDKQNRGPDAGIGH
jgi:hypothetical protein